MRLTDAGVLQVNDVVVPHGSSLGNSDYMKNALEQCDSVCMVELKEVSPMDPVDVEAENEQVKSMCVEHVCVASQRLRISCRCHHEFQVIASILDHKLVQMDHFLSTFPICSENCFRSWSQSESLRPFKKKGYESEAVSQRQSASRQRATPPPINGGTSTSMSTSSISNNSNSGSKKKKIKKTRKIKAKAVKERQTKDDETPVVGGFWHEQGNDVEMEMGSDEMHVVGHGRNHSSHASHTPFTPFTGLNDHSVSLLASGVESAISKQLQGVSEKMSASISAQLQSAQTLAETQASASRDGLTAVLHEHRQAAAAAAAELQSRVAAIQELQTKQGQAVTNLVANDAHAAQQRQRTDAALAETAKAVSDATNRDRLRLQEEVERQMQEASKWKTQLAVTKVCAQACVFVDICSVDCVLCCCRPLTRREVSARSSKNG